MPTGTLGRLRFYSYCELSPLEIDFIPEIADYPEYPRAPSLDFFHDTYKSSLGSNYWRYPRGTSYKLSMTWADVSDNCQATFGLIVGSSFLYSPHTVIFESDGIDGISLASCLASVAPLGTFFVEGDSWNPVETQYGLWSFNVVWRKEN